MTMTTIIAKLLEMAKMINTPCFNSLVLWGDDIMAAIVAIGTRTGG